MNGLVVKLDRLLWTSGYGIPYHAEDELVVCGEGNDKGSLIRLNNRDLDLYLAQFTLGYKPELNRSEILRIGPIVELSTSRVDEEIICKLVTSFVRIAENHGNSGMAYKEIRKDFASSLKGIVFGINS